MEIPQPQHPELVSDTERDLPGFSVTNEGKNWISFSYETPEEGESPLVTNIQRIASGRRIAYERIYTFDSGNPDDSTVQIKLHEGTPMTYILERFDGEPAMTVDFSDMKIGDLLSPQIRYQNGQPNLIKLIDGRIVNAYNFENDKLVPSHPNSFDKDSSITYGDNDNTRTVTLDNKYGRTISMSFPITINTEEISEIMKSNQPEHPDSEDPNFAWLKISEILPVSLSTRTDLKEPTPSQE